MRDTICEESNLSSKSGQVRVLLIESFLLLHSSVIVACLTHLVRINVTDECWSDIARRKWERRHLGTASYKDRGVSFEQYSTYWTHYVLKRFHECAEDDAARLNGAAAAQLVVDGTAPLESSARHVLAALQIRL